MTPVRENEIPPINTPVSDTLNYKRRSQGISNPAGVPWQWTDLQGAVFSLNQRSRISWSRIHHPTFNGAYSDTPVPPPSPRGTSALLCGFHFRKAIH